MKDSKTFNFSIWFHLWPSMEFEKVGLKDWSGLKMHLSLDTQLNGVIKLTGV